MPIFDGLCAADTILKEKLSACVVLLTAFNDAQFIERAKQIGVTGYLVKPVTRRTLIPAIELAYFQSKRLNESKLETELIKKKLEESRVVERAKFFIAKEYGISEGDAYRELQRMAMNKRRSLFSMAQALVQAHSNKELIDEAKSTIMKSEGLSEQAAFKRLKALSQTGELSLHQAALHILSAKEKMR